MRRIRYLVTTAGHPNYGDELITSSWIRYLARRYPQEEVWVDCPAPGIAATLFAGLHPHLVVTDTVWRLRDLAKEGSRALIVERLTGLVRDFGSPRVDIGIGRLRQAHSIHLLGGGYHNDVWPDSVALVETMKAVKALTGAKLYATGLGLLPVNSWVADPRRHFAGFDHVSARDGESAAAYAIGSTVDDAFLALPREATRRREPAVPELVICLQADMGGADVLDRAEAVVRSVVDRHAATLDRIRYVEGVPGTDHPGYERIKDLVSPGGFVPFSDVYARGLPVSERQIWVTTRFHHHLVAAAGGARGIALSVGSDYYGIKHGSLTRLGSGWPVLDLSAGTGPVTLPGPGLAEPGRAIAAKRAEADRIYTEPRLRAPGTRRVVRAVRNRISRVTDARRRPSAPE